MWSPVHNASEYTEELQRCIRDALEKHGVQYTGLYSDSKLASEAILETQLEILLNEAKKLYVTS